MVRDRSVREKRLINFESCKLKFLTFFVALNIILIIGSGLCRGGTGVELSTQYPEIEGSNPAVGNGNKLERLTLSNTTTSV